MAPGKQTASHPARLHGNCNRLEISGLESQAESVWSRTQQLCPETPRGAGWGSADASGSSSAPEGPASPQAPSTHQVPGASRTRALQAGGTGQQGGRRQRPAGTVGVPLAPDVHVTPIHRRPSWSVPAPRQGGTASGCWCPAQLLCPQLQPCLSPSAHLPLGQRPSHASFSLPIVSVK